jgi:ABC-type multidrug transport system permease subunit
MSKHDKYFVFMVVSAVLMILAMIVAGWFCGFMGPFYNVVKVVGLTFAVCYLVGVVGCLTVNPEAKDGEKTAKNPDA